MQDIRTMRVIGSIIICLAWGWTISANATLVTDPIGDFGGLYNGPQSPSLDVVSANVSLVGGTTFDFTGTMNGDISAAPAGSAYVFGLDTGTGIKPFANLVGYGDNVQFNFVVVLLASGFGIFQDILIGPASMGFVSNVQISGKTISASLDASLIPPTAPGISQSDFTWNLWPRSSIADPTDNFKISDFAPNNTNARVTTVPEPGTLGLLAAGLMAIGLLRRRSIA
jgi:hypothetical protein